MTNLVEGQKYRVTDTSWSAGGSDAELKVGAIVTVRRAQPDGDGDVWVKSESGDFHYIYPSGLVAVDSVADAKSRAVAALRELADSLDAEKTELESIINRLEGK